MVLWDAENMQYNYFDQVMARVKRFYRPACVIEIHAFGFTPETLSKAWTEVRDKHHMKWHFKSSNSKNCADLQLTVFAMEQLISPGESRHISIVSDDRDFESLKDALIQHGVRVHIFTKKNL